MTPRLRTLFAVALCSIGGGALAQDIDEIVVSATRTERRALDLPASIDALGADTLREGKPKVNLSESLGRVPGLILQNRQNYAQDVQLSIRGFGFRSNFGIRGVKLYSDGIPASLPDGQGQGANFNLSSAGRIEVMRGPMSSLYGNAPGGVIQLFTEDGPKRPTVTGDFMAASYGTWRTGLQAGGTEGPVNYVADWSQFHTDGWRHHSGANREQFNGKLKWSPDADSRVTLVLNSVGQPDTQDPLGLTRAQVASNPRQVDPVANTFNTRKTNRQEQGGLTYERTIAAGEVLRMSAYFGDRQVRQYQAIPVASPNTYSGGVVDLQRYFGGMSFNWAREGKFLGRPLATTLGVERDTMQDRRRGFDNLGGSMGPLRRDEDNLINGTNAFAQADWRFTESASATAGLRTTRVSFELRDYFVTALNPNDSGRIVYANTSPVFGLSYRLAPEIAAYASTGRGFETPTFTELAYRNGGTGMNTALKPGHNRNHEMGIKGRLGDQRFTLARFETTTRDEIVVDSNTGGRSIFKNASRTRRSGWEAMWNAVLPAGLDAHVAYTMVDATYSEGFVSGTSPAVNAGNRIPGVPRNSLYTELRWQHLPSGFNAAIEARHAGRVYVDDQNNDAAAAYTVANVRFGLEQKARDWRISETLRIDNVANRDYIGSVIVADSNSRFFETAPRRSIAFIVNGRLAF